MDNHQLDHYKQKLIDYHDELLGSVLKAEADGRAADEETAQDIADKATNSSTKEFLFKKSNDDHFILQLIEQALERIDDGTYGNCVACGEAMQEKRLAAVPWAPHCIECQEKQDQGLLA